VSTVRTSKEEIQWINHRYTTHREFVLGVVVEDRTRIHEYKMLFDLSLFGKI
jgi:hypothetical protein